MMLEGIKEETEGQYIICIEHIQQSSYKVYTHLAKGIYNRPDSKEYYILRQTPVTD